MANGIVATYVSSTEFTVSGNLTDDFHAGRRIKAQLNGTFVYSTISGSTYSALTTVTIYDAELTSNLTKVWYGVGIGSYGSLPDHLHDGTEGQGGTISGTGGGSSQWSDHGNGIYYDSGNVGIGTTPDSDIPLVVSGTNTQIRFGQTAESGGYLISTSTEQALMAAGAVWDGSNWIAKAAKAKLFSLQGGSINFTSDTGLTPGNPFTPTSVMRIDDDGKVGIGTDTVSAILDVNSVATNTIGSFKIWENDADGARILLGKSRGASVGSYTVVQDGDSLGYVLFQGTDGDQFLHAAQIQAEVDGTPSNNVMYGRLIFQTNNGTLSTLSNRMTLSADGVLVEAEGAGSGILKLKGGATNKGGIINCVNSVDAAAGLAIQSGGTPVVILTDGLIEYYGNTISGTGDIYCNDIFTAGGTVYIGDEQISAPSPGVLDFGGAEIQNAEGLGGGGTGGGAVVFVQKETVASGTSSVNFDLPQTAKWLKVIVRARSGYNNVNDAVMLRFNNDSGTNYDSTYFAIDALGNIGGSGLDGVDNTSLRLGDVFAAQSPDRYAPLTFEVYNYTEVMETSVVGEGWYDFGGTDDDVVRTSFGGVYTVASGVTSMQFTVYQDVFVDDSEIIVYGYGDSLTSGAATSGGNWILVDETTVISGTLDWTPTGTINGDSDEELLVRFQVKSGAVAGANGGFVQFNGDTAANYEQQWHWWGNTHDDAQASSPNGALLWDGSLSGHEGFGEATLFLKSGTKRFTFSRHAREDANGNNYGLHATSEWNNADDNITSVRFFTEYDVDYLEMKVYRWTDGSAADYTKGRQELFIEYATTSGIDILPGRIDIEDGSNQYALQVSGTLFKDSLSLSASTWYYVYAKPPVSGNYLSESEIELSTTEPTKNTTKMGHYHGSSTDWRCFGAFYSTSASEVAPFMQIGNRWSLSESDEFGDDVSGGTSSTFTSVTMNTPFGDTFVIAQSRIFYSNASAHVKWRNYGSSLAGFRLNYIDSNGGADNYADFLLPVDSLKRGEWRWNVSTTNTLYLQSTGYVLPAWIAPK